LNILFITSNSTGQGHKSITEALSSQIMCLSPDANISVIDGFAEGNAIAIASGRIYNTIAVFFRLYGGLYIVIVITLTVL
jgi:processive 1,2-diacylglycerol beta-glucosyltransferase